MDMQCIICHDHAVLPVRITAFPCACNYDVQICCKKCTEMYLELDKHPSLRSRDKKCFFCPCKRDTRTLSTTNSANAENVPFFSQKVLWRVDNGVYPCPYRCGYQGSQESLGDHTTEECPRRIMLCDCTASVTREEWDNHREHCPLWLRCTVVDCSHKWFRRQDVQLHMSGFHKMTRCKLCQFFWAKNPQTHENHRKRGCTYLEKCLFCRQDVLAKDADEHYREHLHGMDRIRGGYQRVMEGLEAIGSESTAQSFGIKRQKQWVNKEVRRLRHQMSHCREFLNS